MKPARLALLVPALLVPALALSVTPAAALSSTAARAPLAPAVRLTPALAPADAPAACPVPGRHWQSAQGSGWSPGKLALARQDFDTLHSSSLLLVQHGRVVASWGDTARRLTTFSVRKSLLSALFGIAAGNGVIDPNATLAQLGISDSPDPLTPAEQQARVVDLLRARSGVYHASGFELPFQKKGRPARGSHPPGTFWFYNNWDFNTLGDIYQRQTHTRLGEAFFRQVARPTHMQDFRPGDVYYIGGPESIHPGFMFRMSTRDMARFGQLYLCHGQWGARPIVPADWVYKSSHASEMVHIGHLQLGGYEYLWWVEHNGVLLDGGATLPGMFAAEGAGGHYILVIPSLDAVLVYQYANEPAREDTASVLAQTPKGIYDDQFGHLVRLILDARPGSPLAS